MTKADEIWATAVKLINFYSLPYDHFEVFSDNIIPAYTNIALCVKMQEQ